MKNKKGGNQNKDVSLDYKFKRINAFLVVLMVVIIAVFFVLRSNGFFSNTCGDGTFIGNCSEDKPYYCNEDHFLTKEADVCRCPGEMNYSEGVCSTDYERGEIHKSFDYYVHGEEEEVSIFLYQGVEEYVEGISRVYDSTESDVSLRDIKLFIINDPIQKNYLMHLVKKIQNIDRDKTDQARIAVSIVQRIPYGFSNQSLKGIFSKEVSYSRYPYEVLYEGKGVCGERSELLVFLLRELGFGTAIFNFPEDNHQAVGIKCPISESFDGSEYCFIETTAPSIISSDKNNYIGRTKFEGDYEIIPISNGDSLPQGLDEYDDSKTWIKLGKILEEKEELNFFRYYRRRALAEKYGLNGFGTR